MEKLTPGPRRRAEPGSGEDVGRKGEAVGRRRGVDFWVTRRLRSRDEPERSGGTGANGRTPLDGRPGVQRRQPLHLVDPICAGPASDRGRSKGIPSKTRMIRGDWDEVSPGRFLVSTTRAGGKKKEKKKKKKKNRQRTDRRLRRDGYIFASLDQSNACFPILAMCSGPSSGTCTPANLEFRTAPRHPNYESRMAVPGIHFC